MILSLDHLVLTVRDLEATLRFYVGGLGMRHVTFDGRHAVAFGDQKINLHRLGHEFEPKACHPTPGSADLCFVTDTPAAQTAERLRALHLAIEAGPVRRTGARGPIDSVYVRDPDDNLIELACYVTP